MTTFKTLLSAFGAAALVFAGSAAQAAVITDFIDPAPDVNVTSALPYSFTHDITDGLDGFVVGFDTINSATLTIRLIDNVSKDKPNNETFTFNIGSNGASQVFNGSNVPNGNTPTPYDITLVASLPDLILDGKLSVMLKALTGDYIFTDATLSADITRGVTQQSPATQVPEPATALLMAIGLAGFGWRRKSKRTA
ncbi:PEP-CTERM sorting domain-containing protein [Noviherbaspirillum sp. ST9]|uniref:PEP-CTERM sorting domain-containing protein n=1 Tax=Noviherbaspirillum sp. ST9 TaxID=3401606 RepID=UPI003B58990C